MYVNMAREIKKEEIKRFKNKIDSAKEEISKIVVGQNKVINGFFIALLSNGHVLLEGVPGIAKTLIVRAFSHINGGKFRRIQFTTDLLPTDILGITAYNEEKGFYVVQGPIFANFVLADEINRAPPKVQSALLEAMQERQVTIGEKTSPLPFPFFVLATENPIEQMGVFPLPEAQIDRFLFKLQVDYPSMDEEKEILNKNITTHSFERYKLKKIISPKELFEMQSLAKKIFIDKDIEKYIIDIVDATRNPRKYNISAENYIQWGASPRASIGLHIASKANALLKGDSFVEPEFVKEVAHDVLRHRILLNYEGRAKKITTDDIISEILEKVRVP
jgi:MoxR-like ATPase